MTEGCGIIVDEIIINCGDIVKGKQVLCEGCLKDAQDNKQVQKCIMSKEGKCTADYSPLKCDGIETPTDCVFALQNKGVQK